MKLRILTAVPLLLIVIWLIGWAPEWVFLLALISTVEIALYEFFRVSRQAGFKTWPAVGYLAGGVLCLAQAAELHRPAGLESSVLLFLVLLTLALALPWSVDLKQYLGAASATIFGVFYVAFTLSWLVPLRFSRPATGRMLTFLLFLVIWAGDICAYFLGRAIGRTLLFPRVSPKKTVEGAAAGLLGSLLAGWGFARFFWKTADLKTVILLAGLVAVAGQVGDLVESALKRAAAVKDSGAILPGHGGMLDRIDSLLFGAPILWLAVTLKHAWK